MQKIHSMLIRPVDNRPLGLFRIFFGLILILELIYYVRIDLLNLGLRQPAMLFPYDGLEWVHMLPGKGMEAVLFLLFVAAVCITLGFQLRVASIIFLLGFSWIFFQDKSLYNNHLYLFILCSILLIITDTDSAFSISSRKQSMLPAWQLMIFQFQIIVVYFYGGIAKLNSDWLFHMQPAKVLVGDKSDFLLYIIVYGGLVFDLLIGFALLWKPSKKTAIVIAVLFNITNAIIFNDIGLFPFFMIGALILFVDDAMLNNLLKGQKAIHKKKTLRHNNEWQLSTSGFKWGFLLVYVLFQLLFPFRHYLYPGNVDWYGVAQRFSWRMKIQNREMKAFQLTVLDYDTRKSYNLEPEKYLTSAQLFSLRQDPLMLLSFVNFIKHDAQQQGIKSPFIKANCLVTFNGRQVQHMVDPERNLSEISNDEPVSNWVLPLKNP